MPTARADLQQIHDNTGRFNPEKRTASCAAHRGCMPFAGRLSLHGNRTFQISETECRSFAVPGTDYIVAYQPIDNGVEVIRVRHGNQNFRRLFQQ